MYKNVTHHLNNVFIILFIISITETFAGTIYKGQYAQEMLEEHN